VPGRRTVEVLLVLGLLLGAPASASAAPVDDFNDPGALRLAGATALSTSAFSTQVGEPVDPPGACPQMAFTGWWQIFGTGQVITVNTAGSNYDTVIAVYRTAGAPSALNFEACNDNDGAAQTSRVQFPSVRGSRYLVQIGERELCTTGQSCVTGGSLSLAATAPRPPNDDRATAMAVNAGAPVTVDNRGAGQEPAELLRCGSDDYAATLWFAFTAPGIGDAQFSSSASFTNVSANTSDTVLTVYRQSDGAVLGCNDDAGVGGGPSALSLRLAPGVYLAQVASHGRDGVDTIGEGPVTFTVGFKLDLDLDRDGYLRPEDCDDANAGINPGATDIPDDGINQDCSVDGDAVNLDRDGDGWPRPGDCRDDRPDINPGRRDRPRDGVNQDCKRGDADYPVLPSAVTAFFRYYGDHITFTSLAVRRPAKGSKVRVQCKGPGCPFKKKTRKVKRKRVKLSLFFLVRGVELRPGARFTVKVTKRRTVGVVSVWRVRSPRPPTRRDLCLWPGTKRARACP
jgi:hypothetical protein